MGNAYEPDLLIGIKYLYKHQEKRNCKEMGNPKKWGAV